ncbi:MAG: hypothetical protein EX270_11255 [Pseudomonadales bacterium]|nr:MAG: hypothetical protein EX270_11255 [Pseudomonadales bacterium]
MNATSQQNPPPTPPPHAPGPPEYPANVDDCIGLITSKVGKALVVATPLGIGKPNHLLNALWTHAKQDKSITLEIFTALSLSIPRGSSLLERRFLQCFTRRHFGDYPELEYIGDIQRGNVPENMKVTEFYMQSGKFLSAPLAQRWYTSSNYTHASRDIANRGVNVLVVMVGCNDSEANAGNKRYSMGSNPDLTVDLTRRMERRRARALSEGKTPAPFYVVGVVNRHMPYMTGEAEVDANFFDALIDNPQYEHPLFATPRQPISRNDYLIGLYASALVADGGTLQVGIGSLGDALVYATEMRHQDPALYQQVLRDAGVGRFAKLIEQVAAPIEQLGHFEKGLYAATEMFAEGFMHLYEAGVLKRKVYPDVTIQTLLNEDKINENISLQTLDTLRDARAITKQLDQTELDWLVETGVFKAGVHLKNASNDDAQGETKNNVEQLVAPDGITISNNLADKDNHGTLSKHFLGDKLKNPAILHAAFFLGSKDFYTWLHALHGQERELFQMTGVGQINELYNGEARDRAQRLNARFINTTIKVSLLGAACSDALENNQVISGVGGQYNFVAMAHALWASRSIIMLRATRETASGAISNIVWQYPYETIPRHLRDIVISEYGIADLRSKNDEECIKAMLCIADSRFQQNLLAQAKKYNKLDPAWQIPEAFCNNYPDALKRALANHQQAGRFPDYPYGCDFNAQELQLVKALGWLKKNANSKINKLKLVLKSLRVEETPEQKPLLELMDLHAAETREEKINKKLLLLALAQTAEK